MKFCKQCKATFMPSRPMQRVCSPLCALEVARADRAKAEKLAKGMERKADAVKREKQKSKSDWTKEAQTAFNTFIRLRDAAEPCVSCGRHHSGQYHAGHYLSVGARPELRFDPLNVAKQCQPCNTHLHGNLLRYRQALLERHGVEVVEWLEGPHPLKHYSIDDLRAIKAEYTVKARVLMAALA